MFDFFKKWLSSAWLRFKTKIRKFEKIIVEWLYDYKLGIVTRGDLQAFDVISLKNDEKKSDSLYYKDLNKLLKHVTLSCEDVVYDLGCGRGRFVFFISQFKIKKFVGIELQPSVYKLAIRNLQTFRYQGLCNIDFINSDVCLVGLDDATIFYLFNPFGVLTLGEVLNNIQKSLVKRPRVIRILYWWNHYLEGKWLVDDAGFLSVIYDGDCFTIYQSN